MKKVRTILYNLVLCISSVLDIEIDSLIIIQVVNHGSCSSLLKSIKGDGNDGEPDARRKLEFEKKAKIGWN